LEWLRFEIWERKYMYKTKWDINEKIEEQLKLQEQRNRWVLRSKCQMGGGGEREQKNVMHFFAIFVYEQKVRM